MALRGSDLTAQINSHYGLFLNGLVQADDVTLVIFVSEARVDRDRVVVTKYNEGTAHETSLQGNPIETDPTCKSYKLVFEDFVAYQTVDESWMEWSDDEIFTGKSLREFSRSRFLNHAAEHMMLGHYEDMTGGKYRHFQATCFNHIVDVLAPDKPIIEETDGK